MLNDLPDEHIEKRLERLFTNKLENRDTQRNGNKHRW